MDFHCKQVIRWVEGEDGCCEDFPHCEHSIWEAECPECGASVCSTNILGTYECSCGFNFNSLVDGWVDKR